MFKARNEIHGLNRLKRLYWANKKRSSSSFLFSRFVCENNCGTAHCLAGYLMVIDPKHWTQYGSFLIPVNAKNHFLTPNIISESLTAYFGTSEYAINKMFMPKTNSQCTNGKFCDCGCKGHRLNYTVSFEEAMSNFKNCINDIAETLKQRKVV